MRVLKFRHENGHDTQQAHAMVSDLEQRLGVKLMAHAPGGTVDGYVNTFSDGTVEVCLYDDEDLVAIAALPAGHKAGSVQYRATSKADAVLVAQAATYLKNERGFADHPDMGGASVVRTDFHGKRK
jgi:hypothetical protein